MHDLKDVPTKELLAELSRRYAEYEANKPHEKYTLKEMALALKVSKFTLQRWCREGMPAEGGKVDLEFSKVGRDYVFTADEFARIKRLRS